MKNIVIFDEYNEIDLKPTDLLERYIRLTKDDVAHLLIEGRRLRERSCPGCQGKEVVSQFSKFGLQYKECKNCHSLYISPCPDDAALNRYYKEAKSRIFWRDELLKTTNQKRKEKIIKPRFQWILDSTQEYLPEALHFVDINTLQYGYTEEIAKTRLFKRKTLINPFLISSNGQSHSTINVIDTPWWEVSIKNSVDVISLFEVADRTADLDGIFEKINSFLKTNGLCFMTTILASGFDLQILWDRAENLYPPDRLNVLSIEGWQALFKRHNFECLELSTPGILDVEIVVKAYKENPSLKLPKFIQYLLENRNEDVKMAFQEFLQSSLLSSYGRILLRKK